MMIKKRTKFGQQLVDRMTKLADVLIISVLWLAFSIPIITIGASTSAMISTVNKFILKKEGYLFKQFWKSFKSSFKQATAVTIFDLFVYSTLYLNTNSIRNGQGNAILATFSEIFLVIVAIAATSLTPYVLSYIARFSDPLKIIIKNCYVLSLMNFWNTLIIFIVTLTFVGILWLVPILVLALPALVAILLCKKMQQIFTISIVNL
ncbi:hypothetical protein FC15_GL000075 [Lapidilactobacillus concavus DSM 17758]|uniref:Integral membrane protein n=1 Tax=Lapidilactobacillus concavus DSM 17758 TaxID=1423735 RepID=A0A0R1W5K2_9LACO|nr:YesL family protein [Lapidilactobacillus concavus]KRM13089.1 hypothetical protein FC15_GL000075 [Lapidilactobacillus concavus DSM 17758]